jgi:hypothetical protein
MVLQSIVPFGMLNGWGALWCFSQLSLSVCLMVVVPFGAAIIVPFGMLTVAVPSGTVIVVPFGVVLSGALLSVSESHWGDTCCPSPTSSWVGRAIRERT